MQDDIKELAGMQACDLLTENPAVGISAIDPHRFAPPSCNMYQLKVTGRSLAERRAALAHSTAAVRYEIKCKARECDGHL